MAETCKQTKKGARLCCCLADAEGIVHYFHHLIVMSQSRNQKLFREKCAILRSKKRTKKGAWPCRSYKADAERVVHHSQN